MDNDKTTRIEDEFALLQAMYPEQVTFNAKTKEVKYIDSGSSLLLRLPDSYPEHEKPEVISTSSSTNADLRETLKREIEWLPAGEEALDAIINAFRELLTAATNKETAVADSGQQSRKNALHDSAKKQTTIIWLHHLLNTNKRKLVLSPLDNNITGLSKPGYPGVLIFSGPAQAVQDHVNMLKQQNWAAFQVRYEDDVEWIFEHGVGVVEVESMGEVVKDLGIRKNDFLEAMRMR